MHRRIGEERVCPKENMGTLPTGPGETSVSAMRGRWRRGMEHKGRQELPTPSRRRPPDLFRCFFLVVGCLVLAGGSLVPVGSAYGEIISTVSVEMCTCLRSSLWATQEPAFGIRVLDGLIGYPGEKEPPGQKNRTGKIRILPCARMTLDGFKRDEKLAGVYSAEMLPAFLGTGLWGETPSGPLPASEGMEVHLCAASGASKIQPEGKRSEASPGETSKESPPEKALSGDELLVEMYRKHRLLLRNEYPTIRRVFAQRLETQQEALIQTVWGGPDSPFRQWLQKRPEIKEEFYLALDPQHDRLPAALTLFKQLWEKFPDKFEAYAQLAMAVAIVWDDPGGIHRSPTGQHQSIEPPNQLGPMENFQYLVELDPLSQGRIKSLPWEFLVHLVNHRTPLAERKWALANYGSRRVMIGKCYSDVPYDHGMLEGKSPRLQGKPHTLPNIRLYGGLCTCQADFAARVAKSLGVPAFMALA